MTNTLTPLVVNARQLASLLGLSKRTIDSMNASGKLPSPVRLSGRSIRWTVSEIEDWLAAGSPDRLTWNAMRDRA